MTVVSLSEAARCTGLSRQTLYRLQRDGGLTMFERGRGPKGERLLELQGLREHCARSLHHRSNQPWREDAPANDHGEPDDLPPEWNQAQRDAWVEHNRRLERLAGSVGLDLQESRDLIAAVAGLVLATLDALEAAADA